MQVSLKKVTDSITPDLAARLKAVRDKSGIHRAMGMAIVSITKRSFTDASQRASSWAAKKDGSPATLRKSGALAKSIRTVTVSNSGVTVGSDRHYAAIHQLGGQTRAHVIRPKRAKALKTPYGIFKKVNHPGSKIPARPFFPFDRAGKPTPKAHAALKQVIELKLKVT